MVVEYISTNGGVKVNDIRLFRERAGVTQEHVAKSFGIDKSTVSKWETGDAMPHANKLMKLASLYGCTVDDLLNTNAPICGEGAARADAGNSAHP